MSGIQYAGRGQSIKIDASSFERVEEFKYFGTSLTNQNSNQEVIKNNKIRECLLSFVSDFFVFLFVM
jgi:hypothetical protein